MMTQFLYVQKMILIEEPAVAMPGLQSNNAYPKGAASIVVCPKSCDVISPLVILFFNIFTLTIAF